MSNKIFIEQLKNAQSEGFDYVAQDYDNTWYAFKGEPKFINGIWRAYPFSTETRRIKHLFEDERKAPPQLTLMSITEKIKEYEQQL